MVPVIRNLVDWVGHVPQLAAQVAGDRVAAVRHRDILIARAVRGLCSVQRGDDAVMVKRWPVLTELTLRQTSTLRQQPNMHNARTIKRKGQHTPPSSPPPSIGLHRGLELLLGLWHVEIMWWRTTHAVSASRHQPRRRHGLILLQHSACRLCATTSIHVRGRTTSAAQEGTAHEAWVTIQRKSIQSGYKPNAPPLRTPALTVDDTDGASSTPADAHEKLGNFGNLETFASPFASPLRLRVRLRCV
jgi:hypothetical protein